MLPSPRGFSYLRLVHSEVQILVHLALWLYVHCILLCSCLTLLFVVHLNGFLLDSLATELINKLNFLEDEDQDTTPAMNINPFDEPDVDLHHNHLNPFGDPDEEGTCSSARI